VNKRTLRTFVPLALLVLAALTLAACGGGGGSGDEEKITETIETAATTSDPTNCTELETLSFVEQNSEEKGKSAIKSCEEEAEAGEEEAEGVKVTEVSVNGSKATANAEFEGGGLGAQTLELALVEEGGTWKLDHVEGFANYDGKALGEAFEKQFEESSEEIKPEQAKCIAEKVANASKAQAEELFLSGSPEAIVELAESCG
jgi:ABC-type glycerol-3-phosphate transport system substrate-binding protein